MDFSKLTGRIGQSGPLNFGSIFNRSIELFKKVWLQGFITVLLTFVTIIPIYILFYIPLIVAGITDPEMLDSEEMSPVVWIPLIILFPILLLAVMTISILLNAAFLKICKQKDFNEAERDYYFFYFKKKYLGKTIMLSLMMFGLGILGMLACGIGLIYLVVPMSLFPAFLAFDEELNATEIVKSGFALGNKNWLVIFGLIFVMGLLAELGILLCLVGVLFTAMLSKIPIYYMYKDSVGFASEE